MEIISYRDALFESMNGALASNDNTVIFGQGVDDFKGTFGTTLDLNKKYGAHRVMDTPISEEGMTGIAIGAALNGMRVVHIHIRADFVFLALNQIFNMAAKYKYMFGGHYDVPIFIRAVIGRSWGQGAQHSQSPQSLFGHIPGLKVVMPSSSQAIVDNYENMINDYSGPVISLEHRLLYDVKFEVDRDSKHKVSGPDGSYLVREGRDVTIVATSIMVLEAVRAAKYLAEFGIECEVIDLYSISDYDSELVLKSLAKTKKLVVADTSWLKYGVAAEIGRLVCETDPGLLHAPVKNIGMAPTPCPTAKTLEDAFYPNLATLVDNVNQLCAPDKSIPLPDEQSMVDVYKKFKGPF